MNPLIQWFTSTWSMENEMQHLWQTNSAVIPKWGYPSPDSIYPVRDLQVRLFFLLALFTPWILHFCFKTFYIFHSSDKKTQKPQSVNFFFFNKVCQIFGFSPPKWLSTFFPHTNWGKRTFFFSFLFIYF